MTHPTDDELEAMAERLCTDHPDYLTTEAAESMLAEMSHCREYWKTRAENYETLANVNQHGWDLEKARAEAAEAERDALKKQLKSDQDEQESLHEWANVGINAFGELIMFAADDLQIVEGGLEQIMENYRAALKSALQKARAEALDAKLEEAVELLNEPVATHKDPEWRHARSAFLASIGDKP